MVVVAVGKTFTQNKCGVKNLYDKKYYVCTRYGIRECMTSEWFLGLCYEFIKKKLKSSGFTIMFLLLFKIHPQSDVFFFNAALNTSCKHANLVGFNVFQTGVTPKPAFHTCLEAGKCKKTDKTKPQRREITSFDCFPGSCRFTACLLNSCCTHRKTRNVYFLFTFSIKFKLLFRWTACLCCLSSPQMLE